MKTQAVGLNNQIVKNHNPVLKELKKNWDMYLLLVPAIAYFLVFAYAPMVGLAIGFIDYKTFAPGGFFEKIFSSEWVGLEYVKEMFGIPVFWQIVRNTMVLNILGLVIGFPAPIILALMLNEIGRKYVKRVMQSLLYLPHFMSWIVLGGIVYAVLSPKYGVVNQLIRAVGLNEVYFMSHESWWIVVYTLTAVWQGAGWGTIIYLAAITNIDPSLYEAAQIDGAGRLKQMWYVTLPGIMPTVVILLILDVGKMVSIGIEQPLALGNPVVGDVSNVISTYIYDLGVKQGNYSLTTAVGMVQSVINLILIVFANKMAKRAGGEGIW